MAESRWYDKFAPLYDLGTAGDFFYRKPRKAAIEQLELAAGSHVADIFCGTGVDLPLLADQVGDEGTVLAVDGSHGMLEQARVCAGKIDVGTSVEFLQANFSQPGDIEIVEEAIARTRPRHVFFSLGLRA